VIYLVRHAHAGQKKTWSGPDSRRPLSSHGQQEAAGLLIQLHQEPITRIISSPALRCQQTVWPLGRQRRLAVELDRRVDVDATTAQAAAMLLDPPPTRSRGQPTCRRCAARPLTSYPSTLNADDAPLPRPLTITRCRDPMATTTRTTSSSPEQ
jgi:hypothetical protein